MDDKELDAWVGELLLVVAAHCHCGASNAPLLRMKLRDRLMLWIYGVMRSVEYVPDLHGDPYLLLPGEIPPLEGGQSTVDSIPPVPT